MVFLRTFFTVWVAIFLVVCAITVVCGSVVAMCLLLDWTKTVCPMPYAAILMVLEMITYIAGWWAIGKTVGQ